MCVKSDERKEFCTSEKKEFALTLKFISSTQSDVKYLACEFVTDHLCYQKLVKYFAQLQPRDEKFLTYFNFVMNDTIIKQFFLFGTRKRVVSEQ